MNRRWKKGDEAWKCIRIGDGESLSGVHFDLVTVEGYYWEEHDEVKCHNYHGTYSISEDRLHRTLDESVWAFLKTI